MCILESYFFTTKQAKNVQKHRRECFLTQKSGIVNIKLLLVRVLEICTYHCVDNSLVFLNSQ